MAESWKGPTAVIGIATIMITIGIFVYQEWKQGKKDSKEPEDKKVDIPPSDTIHTTPPDYTDFATIIKRWERKIDSIERRIKVYEDSFAFKVKWIPKTEGWMETKREILSHPSLPEPYRKRQEQELDSLKYVLIYENADTLRFRQKIAALEMLKKDVSDSLRHFRSFHHVQ